MRKRRKLIFILLGFVIAAILLLTLWHEREPQYQGKSLSQWAALLNRVDTRDELQLGREAEEAVRQIGTNGLPFLLKWIQYEERPWRTRTANFCGRLPGQFGVIAENLVLGSGRQRRYDAYWALYDLGPLAKPAIPILTKQLRDPTANNPAGILVHIGDDALPPILTILTNAAESPNLRSELIALIDPNWTQFTQTNLLESALAQCLDDPVFEIAISAAGVICVHNPNNQRALQVLTKGVQSPMIRANRIADKYLALYLNKVPIATLLHYLQDTDSPFSSRAAEILGTLTQKDITIPDSVFPALINALNDPRPGVRASAATALAAFNEKAEPAVPALLDAFSDSDFFVRNAATNALFGIPAYSIFRDLSMMEQFGIHPSPADIHYRSFFNYESNSPLGRLLEHPDPRIRAMATNAFQKLSENNSQNQSAETQQR